MPSPILKRIAAETGLERLFPVLAEDLAPRDLQSLLLAVFQKRAGRVREADLVERAGDRPLFATSGVDARVLNTFDRLAFEAAAGFEAVEPSPVAPLGTSRVLGDIEQHSVVTTIRQAEVPGDQTSALAILCANRRRHSAARTAAPIRLCASQRVIRLQPFDHPGFTPHFRLFCLVTAGRDTGSDTFEVSSLREHVRMYLGLFRALNREGFTLTDPIVDISDTHVTGAFLSAVPGARDRIRDVIRAHRPDESERLLAELGVKLPADVQNPESELAALAAAQGLSAEVLRLTRVQQHVFEPLQREFPEARFRLNFARLEGLSYYDGVCLRISPAASDGARYPVVDGGFTTWTARLLQDRKERFLSSGIGTEFVCKRYRAKG